MNQILVAQGFGSPEEIGLYDDYFEENDEGEVRFFLNHTLTPDELAFLQNEILASGVTLTGPITQSEGIVFIPFRKEIAPLLIIGGIVGAIALAGGGILGWEIFKATKAGVPIWVWIIGGLAVLYLFFSSETTKTVAREGTNIFVATRRPTGQARLL